MKLLNRLNNEQSLFVRVMTWCGVIIGSNLLFVLLSIPLLTAGAAWCAVCHTLMRMFVERKEGGDIYFFREFFRGFKNNFRQATIVWLLYLALIALLALEWYWCGQFGGVFLALRYGLLMIAVIATVLLLYVLPTMAAFENSIPSLLRSALYFAMKKPLYLFVIVGLPVGALILTYAVPKLLPLFAFLWCFVGFGLIGAVTAKLLLILYLPFLGKTSDKKPPEGTA